MTVAAPALKVRDLRCTYPAIDRHVTQARHVLAEFLGPCPRADDATMIVSELITNAVRHSRSRFGGTVTLHVELNRSYVWLEVEDQGGPWKGNAGPWDGDGTPDEESEDGRGLFLVAQLAGGSHNCGVIDSVTGSRSVWARLSLT